MEKSKLKLGDRVPPIKIQSKTPGFSLDHRDLFYRFLPLNHGAEVRVATYEYPSQQCTEISKCRIHLVTNRGGEPVFRVSETSDITEDAELAKGGTCDFYYSMRDGELFTEAIIEGAYADDIEYMQYEDGPEMLRLAPGLEWAGKSICRKHPNDSWELDIKYEYQVDTNAFAISIGTREFRCMKVTNVAHPYRGTPPVRLEAEFVNESYFNEDGRCVLVCRFNGPVWASWNQRLWVCSLT